MRRNKRPRQNAKVPQQIVKTPDIKFQEICFLYCNGKRSAAL